MAVSILKNKALTSELKTIVYKVINNNEKKKRIRERTPYL